MSILYHSTNNTAERVSFRQALLNGMASSYGLYMMDRDDIPVLPPGDLASMASQPYARIAFTVLYPYVRPDIPDRDFRALLEDAYDERVIPVDMEQVTDGVSLMWLSRGPTYSFKDFAARFFGRSLNYFLGRENLRRIVVVATSGDTGGAVAHALLGLENVSNVVFFPRDGISERQRRQMTTLGENVYAFAVNGDFDVCQEIAKALLGNRDLAERLFGDRDRFTSANSISIGRLLPQAVYPFYAYSRMRGQKGGRITASIPSGNFGDMMGTVIAKAMGLPIDRIVVGVNENREFPEFLRTGSYRVRPSVWSPSTAMIVSHPSNLARLVELYGGHMHDRIDPETNKVSEAGVIDRMPGLEEMRGDLFSVAVTNQEHYDTIKEVHRTHGVLLDPHGSVGWRALQRYTEGREQCNPGVIYETADPGKFPEDIRRAVGIDPPTPAGIKEQAHLPERVFEIAEPPVLDHGGSKRMSEAQYREASEKIRDLYRG